MRIIHRDLKPSNVFVNTDCTICLGDFGLARTFKTNTGAKGEPVTDLTEYIATRWYRSPEILVKSNMYTTAMDMWAIGCIVAELFLNQPLFAGNSTVHQLQLIVATTGEPTKKDVDSLHSNEAWALIDSLPVEIESDPLADILADADPDALDLVQKLIVFNPKQRLTAMEALRHPYIAAFVTAEDLANIAKLSPLVLPLPDEKQFKAREYKAALYEQIKMVYRTKDHL
ncbi:map-kinase like proteinue [Strigomonas culicis]|nr:map-kinase like proteinue [Strigomonas culicis]|eukprot:EPY23161.1 map-kinase like proteinue [Strigomonas culicis]